VLAITGNRTRTSAKDERMPSDEREPRANHEQDVATTALPLLVVGGVATYLLNIPLGRWWCATVPAFMLLSRATLDEALHAAWIIPDALAFYLSGLRWTSSLALMAVHAAASIGLSYFRQGKAGDTAKRIVLVGEWSSYPRPHPLSARCLRSASLTNVRSFGRRGSAPHCRSPVPPPALAERCARSSSPSMATL
jgi:hypothetical protein